MFRMPRLQEGWLSLLLLVFMIQSAVLSVVTAGWVDGLDILPLIAAMAIVWGLLFSKLRLPGIVLHILGLAIGTASVGYLVCSTFPGGTLEERLNELMERLLNWVNVAVNGGIGNDNLLFLLLLSAITWFIGYFGAWTVFHSHSGWLVSLAAGTALVINLSYAPQLGVYFLAFTISAILLTVRLNIHKQEGAWRGASVSYSGDLGWSMVRTSFLITALVVVIAWLTPTTLLANQPVSEAFAQVSGPWDVAQAEFNRLFGGVRPKDQAVGSGFGKTLALKSGVKLGGDVVLLVSGTESRRLRGVVYEKYTGQGWLAAERPAYRIPADEERPGLAADFKLREDITQTITVVQPRGTIVFAPSIPKRISIVTTAEMELPPSVVVDMSNAENSSPGLRDATKELMDLVAREKLSFPSGDGDVQVPQNLVSNLSRKLAANFTLSGLKMRSEQITTAELRPIDAAYADASVLRSPSVARRGFRYSVVSSVSRADVESLRKSGIDYPDWVKKRYLTLPRTVTLRTLRLARRITFPYDNPYEAALALETNLRTLGYSDSVTLPPSARDGVDYFLFDGKEGYCDYFASAFVVMARAVGIPARVVSGFAPGDPDPGQGITVVRDWHAHSWPEVYFPEYGWIEFEPTPARPLVPRPETPPDLTPATTNTKTGEEDERSEDAQEALAPEFAEGELPTSTELSDGGAVDLLSYVIRGLATIVLLGMFAYTTALYVWRRGIVGLPPGEAAYAKMCRLASWLGIARQKQQTPYEYAFALSAIAPDQRRNIQMIADAYVRQVFGRKNIEVVEEHQLAEAWAQLRSRLLRIRLNRREVGDAGLARFNR